MEAQKNTNVLWRQVTQVFHRYKVKGAALIKGRKPAVVYLAMKQKVARKYSTTADNE